MNGEQKSYIATINSSQPEEIFIKKTGWEEIVLPAHAHNKEQIIYTLSGTLRVQIGNTNYFVPEKHIAWIPAGVEHELCSHNRLVSLVIFYLSFEEADVMNGFSIYNTTSVIAENLKFIASKGKLIRRDTQADLFQFTLSFFKLLPAMNPEKEILLKTLVIPDDQRLVPVLHYIAEHCGENLKIETVAKQFGFSLRNLSRLFFRSNIRFSLYLNYQRVTRAIELLADREKTLSEIAYEVGFSTPNNFNRVFKQITGMSPGQFVKMKNE